MLVKVAFEANDEVINNPDLQQEFELEPYGFRVITRNLPNLPQAVYQTVVNVTFNNTVYYDRKPLSYVQLANDQVEFLMVQTDKAMYKPGEKVRLNV